MSCDAILRFNMIKIIIGALGRQFFRQNDQNPTSGDKCAKSTCDPDKTFATLSSRASENTIRGPSDRARWSYRSSLGSARLLLEVVIAEARDIEKNVPCHVFEVKTQRKPLFSLL